MQVDPAETLMREVGAQLRRRRLERGEDLDDVAKSLRIKPSYLVEIERGDLSALPGGCGSACRSRRTGCPRPRRW
jgi:hypothetical protein